MNDNTTVIEYSDVWDNILNVPNTNISKSLLHQIKYGDKSVALLHMRHELTIVQWFCRKRLYGD